MPASSWLKKSSVPFKEYVRAVNTIYPGPVADRRFENRTVTYRDPGRKAYKWKGFAPGLALEVHPLQIHPRITQN